MTEPFTPPAWTPAPAIGPASAETPATPPARPRRTKWWIALGGGIAAVVAVAAFVGFVQPGFFVSSVYDTAALQKSVLGVLRDRYQIGAEAVACPADVPVEEGLRFSCNALVGGAQQVVAVRVLDADGRLEVTRPR